MGNRHVSFGDVNLAEDSISGPPHKPGTGGWPTIRYFNKETGLEGANYVKQTDKAMCEELGDEDRMFEYVMEAGNTFLCSVVDFSGTECDEREIEYIQRMQSKSAAERTDQISRLANMENKSMTAELKQWLTKRKRILNQLVGMDTAGEEL